MKEVGPTFFVNQVQFCTIEGWVDNNGEDDTEEKNAARSIVSFSLDR